MKGHNQEAKMILLKASKINRTSLSESSISMLDEHVEFEKSDDDLHPETSSHENQKRSENRKSLLILANVSYLWFATIFVYYGLNINSVYLEYWDKYISFIVSSAHFFLKTASITLILRLFVLLNFQVIL